MPKKQISFENAIQTLEERISSLENGDLTERFNALFSSWAQTPWSNIPSETRQAIYDFFLEYVEGEQIVHRDVTLVFSNS